MTTSAKVLRETGLDDQVSGCAMPLQGFSTASLASRHIRRSQSSCLPLSRCSCSTLRDRGRCSLRRTNWFVRDGPVWSSAGVTAGIDLALALVEQDLGRGVALDVARHLVVFLKHPGGQAQFSAALSLQSVEDRFGALHRWVGEHLDGDLSLAALATQAGMSEHSFSRRYAEATGLTPARAVERLWVEAARRLLADTRLPAKRIAACCGFGSEETLRRSFLRLPATAPQDYRSQFVAR